MLCDTISFAFSIRCYKGFFCLLQEISMTVWYQWQYQVEYWFEFFYYNVAVTFRTNNNNDNWLY